MAWAPSPTPGSLPPISLKVALWQPEESGLPADLFPWGTLITATLDSGEMYRLSWHDKAQQEYSMNLLWTGESFLGSGVTINGPCGTIATGVNVNIHPDSDHPDWDGHLTTQSSKDGDDGNTGVFIAQASTGGAGDHPYDGPEDESGRSAGAGTSPPR